ncbi:MAG TPA: hypothetical protein PLR98_01675 [Chitinophagaceae bacterium]|nr:hypothetical protein [Chitinophagaceae bacterium]HRF22833.1 hypothetical protein [Chitinophagaceae bacterium]
MKKLVTTFFLFIFLSANTAFGEVLKMPLLIHHYIEHTQEDNDNSILDFLAQHYGNKCNHQHSNNHHNHEKLPFKTADCHFAQVITVAPTFITFTQAIPSIAEIKIPAQQQDYSNAYLGSIWQPPKVS